MLLTREEINETMSELAKYLIIKDETETIVDSLKKKLKEHMIEAEVDKLVGDEHMAKLIHSRTSRIDGKSLKEKYPELAEEYTTVTPYDYVKLTS